MQAALLRRSGGSGLVHPCLAFAGLCGQPGRSERSWERACGRPTLRGERVQLFRKRSGPRVSLEIKRPTPTSSTPCWEAARGRPGRPRPPTGRECRKAAPGGAGQNDFRNGHPEDPEGKPRAPRKRTKDRLGQRTLLPKIQGKTPQPPSTFGTPRAERQPQEGPDK